MFNFTAPPVAVDANNRFGKDFAFLHLSAARLHLCTNQREFLLRIVNSFRPLERCAPPLRSVAAQQSAPTTTTTGSILRRDRFFRPSAERERRPKDSHSSEVTRGSFTSTSIGEPGALVPPTATLPTGLSSALQLQFLHTRGSSPRQK